MNKGGIVIGSSPSSGSTLLITTLGRSGRIYTTDELYIFDKPDWIAGRTPDLKENWEQHFRCGYPSHFAHESPLVFPYEDHAPKLSEFDGSYAEFCIAYMDQKARDQGFSRWAEKTPTNIFALPALSTLFADLRILIIVRHPGAVLNSLSKRSMNPFIAAARVYYPMLVAANLAGRDNVHMLKYEDLTDDPTGTLKPVFDFIGELYDETCLEPSSERGIELQSWEFKPSMRIKKRGEPYAEIGSEQAFHLTRLRANAYFMSYVGIDRHLSFRELCDTFGYDVTLDPVSDLALRPRLDWLDAYARYAARALLSRRPVRKLWQ